MLQVNAYAERQYQDGHEEVYNCQVCKKRVRYLNITKQSLPVNDRKDKNVAKKCQNHCNQKANNNECCLGICNAEKHLRRACVDIGR